jgi:hypothetical protein
MPDADPIASAVTADQVAAHATEPRGHGAHGPFHTHCENCGTELKGPFCHACGQHDFEFHRSFGHVFLEALENFFHFDAKFFRNIVTLLFRPGVLTADFNAGKRASQMPPFRLYVFVSLLFFFLSFVGRNSSSFLDDERHKATGPVAQQTNAHGPKEEARPQSAGTPAQPEQLLDAAPHSREAKTAREDAKAVSRPETAAAAAGNAPTPTKQIRPMPGGINLTLQESNDNAFERYISERGRYAFEHPHELKEAFVHAMPKMLLFCLPLFALCTRVLFRKSGHVYLQHLVLALHFHTFIYLFQPVRTGWVELGSFVHLDGVISFAAGIWLAVYPFVMFRRLFGTGWWATIWRTLTVALAYWCILCLAFVGTIMLIFVML